MFIIQDWASNTLQFNGKFNFGAYGENKGSPMEFKSFDDAIEWMDQNVSEEDRENLYIKKCK
jgi:hypothetical protein